MEKTQTILQNNNQAEKARQAFGSTAANTEVGKTLTVKTGVSPAPQPTQSTSALGNTPKQAQSSSAAWNAPKQTQNAIAPWNTPKTTQNSSAKNNNLIMPSPTQGKSYTEIKAEAAQRKSASNAQKITPVGIEGLKPPKPGAMGGPWGIPDRKQPATMNKPEETSSPFDADMTTNNGVQSGQSQTSQYSKGSINSGMTMPKNITAMFNNKADWNNPTIKADYEDRKNHQIEQTRSDFKQIYGKELEDFNNGDYAKWAHAHNVSTSLEPGAERGSLAMRKSATAEDKREAKKLSSLADANSRNAAMKDDFTKGANAFAGGMASGLSFGWADKAAAQDDKRLKKTEIGEYVRALDEKNSVSNQEYMNASYSEHPRLHTAGEISGDLLGSLAFFGLGAPVANAGLNSIPKFSKLAPAVQKSIQSAVMFGTQAGAHSTASQTWSKDEWDRREERIRTAYAEQGTDYEKKEYSLSVI